MFGRVASHGALLLPVSDTEELFVQVTAVPSNVKGVKHHFVDVHNIMAFDCL